MKNFGLILLMLSFSCAAAGETYLCVVDETVGFDKKGVGWEPTIFQPESKKIVIKISEEGVTGTVVGERPLKPNKSCTDNQDIVFCGTFAAGVMISRSTLKYVSYRAFPYLHEYEGSTLMSIGKCSPL